MRKQFNSIAISLLLIFSFGKSFAQCGSLLAPDVTDITKCIDYQNTVLTATAKGSGKLQWFDGDNTTTATKLGSPSASYTSTFTIEGIYKFYIAEFDNVNKCYGPISLLSLTINPKPKPEFAANVLSNYCYNYPTGIIDLNGYDSKLLAGTDVFKVTEGSVTTKQSLIVFGTFTADKKYIVEYVRTTDKQCKDSITKDITIHYVEAPAIVASAPTIIGYGKPKPSATATLTATSLQWYQKNGTKIPAPLGTATAYTHPGPEPTSDMCYTYNVLQKDDFGCSSALASADLCYSKCLAQAPTILNKEICIYDPLPCFTVTRTTNNAHKYEFVVYNMSPYSYPSMAQKLGVIQGTCFTPTITTISAQIYKYWVAEHDLDDDCMGPGTEFSLMIKETKAPVAVTNSPICQSTLSMLCLNVNQMTAADVYWYDNTANTAAEALGSNFINKGTPYCLLGINTLADGKYTRYASQVIGGCQSAKTPVSFTIVQKPVPPVLISAFSCENKPYTELEAQPTGGNNVRWYADNTSNPILAKTLKYKPSGLTKPTNIFVATQISGDNCVSDPATVIYTLFPQPAKPFVSNPQVICDYATTAPDFVVSNVTGTIVWVNIKTKDSLASGLTYKPTIPAIGTASVIFGAVQKENGCVSDTGKTLLASIKSPNKPTLVSDTIPMCYNQGIHKTFEVSTKCDSIQWYLNNSIVSGGTKFDYYPQGIGIDTFTVTPAIKYKNSITKDSQTCVGQSLTFTQKVQLEPYTKSNFTILSQVKVFPNPTTSIITITLGDIESETTIVLYDILGIILQTGKTKNESVDFDLSGYASGIYSISVSNKKGYWLGTVVKE